MKDRLLIAATLAVAAVSIFVACGGSGGTASTAATSAPAATSGSSGGSSSVSSTSPAARRYRTEVVSAANAWLNPERFSAERPGL